MPSSIPFNHPSLVLGNIVNPDLFDKIQKIGAAQEKIDAARDKLNSFVAMKRSLAMTINELVNIQVNVDALNSKISEIDKSIESAALEYMTIQLTKESEIQTLRATISDLELKNIADSPVDFDKSEIKKLPLASQSLKLDAQYFSFGSNNEDNPQINTIADIEKFVKEATSSLGENTASEMSKSAGNQVKMQKKNNIFGTLVITTTCTHHKVVQLSPMVLDPDKTVDIWNKLQDKDPIDTDTKNKVLDIIKKKDTGKNSITLLTGMSRGSSFVGMVHILKKESTSISDNAMMDIAAELQNQFTLGAWLEGESGGIGTNDTIADGIRQLLSTQNISSHISINVFGAIPSIRSNQVELGVKTFSDLDPVKTSKKVSTVENDTSADKKSISQAAKTATAASKMAAMESATIQSVMSGLAKIDQSSNKMLDINSLMTAFEDYLEEIKKDDAGIPIDFYTKNITKREIARIWLKKYFPEEKI